MRQIVFASPEESSVGDEAVQLRKSDYLFHLGVGKSQGEAATLILVEPEEVALWKRQDANFRQRVMETLALVEMERPMGRTK